MMWRPHPSAARLQAWIETGQPARVARHVDQCEQCLAAVEDLTSLGAEVVADLAAILAPPEGIEDRTSRQLARRLRDEDAVVTFLDLFSVGWATARILFEPDADAEDAPDGGRDGTRPLLGGPSAEPSQHEERSDD